MYTKYLIALLLLAAMILAGCQVQPVETYYRGYKSVNESAKPLVRGDSQMGQWQTFDMQVDYRTRVGQDDLAISGTAKLGQYYLMNTNRLRKLDLYLFFLDDSSKVIKTVELSNGLTLLPEEIIAFNQDVKMPEAASFFAFGYRGEALRDDGGGGDKGNRGEGGAIDIFHSLPRKDS